MHGSSCGVESSQKYPSEGGAGIEILTKQRSQRREVSSGVCWRREQSFGDGQVATEPGPLQGGLHRPRKYPVQWGAAWWTPHRCFDF